jgi:hypothetical protein
MGESMGLLIPLKFAFFRFFLVLEGGGGLESHATIFVLLWVG